MQTNNEVDRWLMTLDRSFSSPSPTDSVFTTTIPTTYHFRFLLSPASAHSKTVKVELMFARTLKSGKISVYKSFNVNSKEQHGLLDETTKTLLVELKGMKSFYDPNSYYYSSDRGCFELAGNEGEQILMKLLESASCCWTNENNAILKLGPDKVVDWNWQLDGSDGAQTLHYHRGKKILHLFFIQQAWYCDPKTGEVGIMQTGMDPKAALNLLSLSKLPMDQAEKVASLVEKHRDKFPIQAPQVAIEEPEAVAPVPCLHLFKKLITDYPQSEKAWKAVTTEQAVAELSFDYKNIITKQENKQSALYSVRNDQVFRIQRDRAKEEEYIRTLITSGWISTADIPYPFQRFNSSLPPSFLMDLEENDPLDFSAQILPQLKADGWRIDIAKDYPYQVVTDDIEDWYSSLEEESNYNWFGLELGITLKGEKINLLPVLQKALKKFAAHRSSNASVTTQDFIEKEAESTFAKLPDGRYIQLPTERIRNILNVFIELYDDDSLSSDNKLRLSNLHAMRLIDLEKAMGAAQLRWIGGERLRRMGKKLTEFSGIQIVEPPSSFQGTLRPYQIEGLSWLQFLREYDLSGVLADDMGLGKTVQALAHLLVEKMSGRMQKSSLIVAPTSLMFNWQMEAERFAPGLKVLLLHGAARKNLFEEMAGYDLILTTYPLIVRDKDILLKQDFYFLILDEAQCIKNAKSQAAQITLQIKAKHRLCLTGTPMENHLGELWSLFHFMMPGLLGEQKQFTRLFRTPIEKHADYERRVHLNRRVAPFLLRRTKDKVMEELPEKVEMIRQVELDGPQRDLYETIRITMQKKVRDHVAELGLSRSHIFILDALLKLRQVCCDPRLLKIPSAQKKGAKSAKLQLLMTSIIEMLQEGRRILLFSQFTEMLSLIEEELHQEKIPYLKLTGQTQDRRTPVQQFQEGKVPLFLISLKAGGTGLNLTAADTVIHYDPWWNPAVEHQATDRAHRIGQNKTVFVYKFVAKGTVEEKILEMQKNKQALMDGLFSGEETSKLKMTEKDLQSLFDPLE